MADVAAAAGVAVQTVYFVFHTKTELRNSTYFLAVMGENDPAPPEMQEWYRQAVSEADATSAVRLVVGGVAEILRRVAPLDQVVRSAAAGDPDAAAFLSHNEGMRVIGDEAMVSFLHLKRPLRHDLTEERATDVMLLLLSPGVYLEPSPSSEAGRTPNGSFGSPEHSSSSCSNCRGATSKRRGRADLPSARIRKPHRGAHSLLFLCAQRPPGRARSSSGRCQGVRTVNVADGTCPCTGRGGCSSAAREALTRDPNPGRRDRAEPLARPDPPGAGWVMNTSDRDPHRGACRARLGVLLRHVALARLDAAGQVSDFSGPVDQVGTTYVRR